MFLMNVNFYSGTIDLKKCSVFVVISLGLSNKVQKDVEVEKYLSESSRSCAKNEMNEHCLKIEKFAILICT